MKEWFFNDLSKEQSYSALVDKPPGTFLVRISANPMHIAVISMVYENFGVIHILVEYEASRGFFLQVRHFALLLFRLKYAIRLRKMSAISSG